MHAHEHYWNHPFQLSALTPDQQQRIEEDLTLMTQKWFYPYEYMGCFEQFQEPQVPPEDAFCISLTEEDISKTDCTHG